LKSMERSDVNLLVMFSQIWSTLQRWYI
jgi:hypothetical protein